MNMRTEYSCKGLSQLIDSLKKDKLIGVEIGSYAGESAKAFIDTGHIKTLICIDIWEIQDCGYGNTYNDIAVAEQRFDKMQAESNGKIIKFKGTIDDFIASDLYKQFTGKIDFVYIDALHTYDGCKHDILQTMEFLKPLAAIAGHDYADSPAYLAGVKKAVNEIFEKPDVTFCDSSWIKYLNVI